MTTATKEEATFRLGCSVKCELAAPPERIWAVLTDADAFPRWNSTITSLFEMTEIFSDLMLPMIKGSVPDFGPTFEAYAADLKRAAEGSK